MSGARCLSLDSVLNFSGTAVRIVRAGKPEDVRTEETSSFWKVHKDGKGNAIHISSQVDPSHALQEVGGATMTVARTPEQVAQLLAYVTWGELNK